MGLLLLILVVLFLVGGLPRWGYHSYGYGPSGIAGALVIVCVVLLLTGRLCREPSGPGRQGAGEQSRPKRRIRHGILWLQSIGRAVVLGAATTGHERGTTMGSKTDKIKGRLKEAGGVLTDDDSLKREGQRDQIVGKVKETAERAAEKVKETAEKVAQKVKDKVERAKNA
jgi:uncharacterized protein YjbJ (UPF0337 family)